MRRRVVITGVGAVTPLGVGARTLHRRWLAGECGIVDGLGRCTDFDPAAELSPKHARRMDRFSQLALVAAREAATEAGFGGGLPYEAHRVGCVIGTGVGGIATIEAQHDVLRDRGPRRISPLALPVMMANAAAAQTSMDQGLTGPVYGVVSACAAGAHAIGDAMRMIQAGDADAAVAGGTESALTELSRAAFAVMSALSPTGRSLPFDARRDGFVLGEGAGALVLEEREAARARGAHVLAELRGYGTTADAHHITAPEPEGRGAARAIERALADAGASADEVSYVNAHGTATPLNDRVETAAIKTALGEAAAKVPVSSTKSAIGHLLGAAGAVEAIATVLGLRDRTAGPTLGYEQPDESLDLDYVPDGPRPLHGSDGNGGPLLGLSNSFAFGGHNVVLCIAGA